VLTSKMAGNAEAIMTGSPTDCTAPAELHQSST
jgi:hypothetical protein